MKNIRIIVLAGLTSLAIFGCSMRSSNPDEWPEMEAFHIAMAEAYHPYKDSSNLEPARKLALELVVKSTMWANSKYPNGIVSADMKPQLVQLDENCKAFADKVVDGDDDASVGAALDALHEEFHGIMEQWNKSGHKGSEKK